MNNICSKKVAEGKFSRIADFSVYSKWVLDLVSQGNKTFAQISDKIRMDSGDLEFLLTLMEHKGYLRSAEPPKRTYCPMLDKICGYQRYLDGMTYFLTEKGKGITIKDWETV